MEFDPTAVRHSLAVAMYEPTRYDVFVRTDGGQVEHYWAGEGVMFGPERLGGDFDTDPKVIKSRDGDAERLHLIGLSGFEIVDWSWPSPSTPGWLGPPTIEKLPGFSVSEPQPVWTDRLEIFATGIEGYLRHWTLEADGWSGPRTVDHFLIFSSPAAIQRAPGVLDVFAIGDGLRHWTRTNGVWKSEVRRGEGLIGPLTVASYSPQRLDVFAVRTGGVPVHWGWNGTRWFDAEERLDMTFPNGSSIVATDVQLVSYGLNRLTLFTRTVNGPLVEWTFQTPDYWSGPNAFSGSARRFAAWSLHDEQIEVLSRNRDGSFNHDFFENNPNAGMGEPVAGTWDDEFLPLAPPEPPPVTITPLPPDPDLLLVRPRDLVLLGLRFAGLDVQAPQPGAPGGLSAGDHAMLAVMFPPQHLAEEVDSGQTFPPPGPDRFRIWNAALSGPSRVVVDLCRGDLVTLTVGGVLDALRRGRVRPGDGMLDGATAIELPYGLVVSPHSADGSEVRCTHPADEAASPKQTVGLWQTRIAVEAAAAGSPAGLVLHPLAADSTDPFTVPLRGGARARILLEEPTARIDRLALSALGGTLTAYGSWPGFTWEHVAALGRDRRVRVTTEGVMYPFGHRAEFIEITERIFESTSDGAIARLRSIKMLRITQRVRPEPADAALRAAFPFAEVEIERTVVEGLDQPTWCTKDLPSPEVTELKERQDDQDRQARQIYEKLYGDMRPSGGMPPIEDLAAGLTPDAGELLDPDEPIDPDNPEPPPTRADAARDYLRLQIAINAIDEALDALAFGGIVPLDVFFVPHKDKKPVTFPVRLAGRLGDLHIELPLVFVADIDWRGGLITSPFQSLHDTDIADRVAKAHQQVGGDVVDVGGTRIDLVRADEPYPADVCEVRKLHLVGTGHDGGFRPRLGASPQLGEDDVPAQDRWGVEVDLPAVRTLLGTDAPPLTLALSKALLESAPDLKVPFQVPDTFPKLATEFAKNTARSGGIVAPDIVADAISREHGPVCVAGLLPNAVGQMDPKKILSEGATLLGFTLADLIDAADLDTPPQILTVAQPGLPPKVTMTWSKVKLSTDSGSFVTTPQSIIDIAVALGTAQQQVTCTVENIALALPDRSNKLLQVSFRKIVFTQTGGAAPNLDVDGIGVELSGVLELLEDLQKAVDLGGKGPHIDASTTGVSASYTLPVPDVTAGVFQLTNLVFHAGVDVPFDGRPVSISLAFASRQKPFNVSVLVFGGGGYVDLTIDCTGLRRIEIALEFGASLAMNFVVAQGEVHGMGGIRLVKDGEAFAWSAYLRFGGSVSVFGLVTVSVEVTVTLTYHSESKKLTGRATLVLEIDLTLFSESVSLDTGEWELVGGAGPQHAPATPVALAAWSGTAPDEWTRYRAAYAKGQLP
ncbi:hypothetical protein GA0074695_4292 [Micromonospora viridifaciens]|uniref:Uncharacterized protein n=1 Tax=Micromonospora viridifaciens TaxID=1881 RepID=A0A1C4YHH2_MICVI|nr:hypothetical protein [Micromonospora viridifaciens]SCF20182.1 hypothetical protein GA0074695_4292 [Micromonospora viridifaciens]